MSKFRVFSIFLSLPFIVSCKTGDVSASDTNFSSRKIASLTSLGSRVMQECEAIRKLQNETEFVEVARILFEKDKEGKYAIDDPVCEETVNTYLRAKCELDPNEPACITLRFDASIEEISSQIDSSIITRKPVNTKNDLIELIDHLNGSTFWNDSSKFNLDDFLSSGITDVILVVGFFTYATSGSVNLLKEFTQTKVKKGPLVDGSAMFVAASVAKRFKKLKVVQAIKQVLLEKLEESERKVLKDFIGPPQVIPPLKKARDEKDYELVGRLFLSYVFDLDLIVVNM